MNEEQQKIVDRAKERAHRTIEALKLEPERDVGPEIESYRAEIEMLHDERFMDGLFDSLAAIERGERGVRLKDIKRKYKRA